MLSDRRWVLPLLGLLSCTAHRPTAAKESVVSSTECGALRALWKAAPAGEGVWDFRSGETLLHSSAPGPETLQGPFSPDCARAAVFERQAARIAVFLLPMTGGGWPDAALSIAVPRENGRACEIASLRWHDVSRLSFLVGCSGWHGFVPVLVDPEDPAHWLLDGPEQCRIVARFSGQSANCEAAALEPLEWKR